MKTNIGEKLGFLWLAMGLSLFFYDSVMVFWMLGGLLFFGTRLENSMDEQICGKRMANHNIERTNLYTIILLFLELLSIYFINFF
jgi:hypothetical protein